MTRPLSEADRRRNVESAILAKVCQYGGETIIASPRMDRLVTELREVFEGLVRDGRFLPTSGDVTHSPRRPE